MRLEDCIVEVVADMHGHRALLKAILGETADFTGRDSRRGDLVA